MLKFILFLFIFYFNHGRLSAESLPELVNIWDIKLGMKYTDIPTQDFMFFACGTDGGPPSKPLKNKFADFHHCKEEDYNLKEVYFEYDDEAYFWAMAQNDTHSAGFQGTKVFSHPAIISLLFDEYGIVKAIRIATDDRVPHNKRKGAAGLFIKLESVFGKDPWLCEDFPPGEGEIPIAGRFTKKLCFKEKLDKTIILQGHYYRKKGQTAFNSLTKKATEGYFKSKTILEVYSSDIDLHSNEFKTIK